MKVILLEVVMTVLVIKVHGQDQQDKGKLSSIHPIALQLIKKACEGAPQTEATALLNGMLTILSSLEHGRSKRSIEEDLDQLSRSLVEEDEDDVDEDDLELDTRVLDDDEELEDVDDDIEDRSIDDKEMERTETKATKQNSSKKSELVERLIRQLKHLKRNQKEILPTKKSNDKTKDKLVRQLRNLYDSAEAKPKQLLFIIRLLLSAHKNMESGNQGPTPTNSEQWNWNGKIAALRKIVQHLHNLLMTDKTNVHLEVVCGALKHALNKN